MEIKNIDIETTFKKVKLGKEEVSVKQYLKSSEKSQMFDYIKLNCFDKQFNDYPEIDAVFNALVILNYTDIKFEFETIEELKDFYDYMEIKDYVSIVIEAIPSIEYNSLISYFQRMNEEFNDYKTSSKSSLEFFMRELPEALEEISNISNNIDLENLKDLVALNQMFDQA